MEIQLKWSSEMQKTGVRGQKSGVRIRDKNLFPLFTVHSALGGSLFTVFLLSACATPALPPNPPKYVYKEEIVTLPTVNSLWRDTASLYEDRKAKRLNDLVTIRVVESTTGSGKATTKTARDSSADYGITDLFGLDLNFGSFSPTVKGSGKSDFEGKGDTLREGKLIGTITAKVVEVMPNGNLVVESRKDITINNEKQILVFRGMIRPDDVLVDNSILSSNVADAEIYFVGAGVIQDKQKQGWLVRILDKIWPF